VNPIYIPVLIVGTAAVGFVGFLYWGLTTGRIVRITRDQSEFAGDVLMDIDEITRPRS
jgi:hypothetical protein